ncbi:MAG: hypothetical protein L6R41_001840 [Letrouitia leprolyta]|nr:MAG: hypothetical protein L6R41_001840 [Letrouitia leprolyta]
MSLLFYRRPDYVAKLPGPMNLTQCQIYVERTQKHRRAIPPELSFENIIQNKALPPCALQDFMDYLVYVSHDAENLQFWLWLQAYTKKFYATSPSEQALSPPWSIVDGLQPTGNDPNQPPRTADKSKYAVKEYEINFDQQESPMSPTGPMSPQFDKQSFISGMANTTRSAADSVEDANAQVGLKWQSFTIQPFRSEINRVISHYIAPNSPRELNLSHKTRAAVLHALQHTTHPSAFSLIRDIVEGTLRGQSHPNFIRWSICNGNKPRVLFVRNSGIAHVVGAIILAIILILSHASRWWRLFCFPLFLVGFSIGVAAYKGLCVIIHTGHCRNLRPWEQFGDGASMHSFDNDDEAALSTDDVYNMSNRAAGGSSLKRGISMDTFGTSNSYDHELWVEKYRRKPLLQRIFAKNIWIQEETVRVLQDRIVVQSHVWSFLVSVPLTVAVVAVPVVGLY